MLFRSSQSRYTYVFKNPRYTYVFLSHPVHSTSIPNLDQSSSTRNASTKTPLYEEQKLGAMPYGNYEPYRATSFPLTANRCKMHIEMVRIVKSYRLLAHISNKNGSHNFEPLLLAKDQMYFSTMENFERVREQRHINFFVI